MSSAASETWAALSAYLNTPEHQRICGCGDHGQDRQGTR